MQPFKTALLLAAVLAVAPVHAAVYSIPQGVMNFTIPAGSASTPSVSTFSLPLTAPVPENFVGDSNGFISSVTATTITCSSAGWAAGALSQPTAPYFLRITSGQAAGRTLLISTTASQANTSTTVTVNNQGTPLDTLGIAAGDTYEVFPAYTLSTVFGGVVLGGTAPSNADVVRLHSGSSWVEYYYNTSVGQWRIGSVPVSQSNVAIRPDSGIIFYRRGSTPIVLTLLGKVPSTDLQLVVNEVGASFVGGFPVSTQLVSSDYRLMPNWVDNTSSVQSADKVTFFISGSWKSYNYNQTAGQWRISTVPVDQGAVTVAAGVPVIIESPTGTPGIKIWHRTLPYSLTN